MGYNRTVYGYMWLSFLVMPIIPLWYSIKNFCIKPYRIFILLFAMLLGFSFVPPENTDGMDYKEKFKEYQSINFNELKANISTIYSKDAKVVDIYAVILMFLVSRFTNNPAIFFMIAAMIYYIFFLKLFDIILSFSLVKKKTFIKYFLIGSLFIFTFTLGINGVRWALAFIVFSCGTAQYLKSSKISSIIFAGLSCLIHFSFLYSFIFLLLFVLIRSIDNNFLPIGFLLVAIIFTSIFVNIINQNIHFGGEFFEQKISAYTSDSYLNFRSNLQNTSKWFIQFNRVSTFYFVILSLVLTRVFAPKLHFDRLAKDLFAFSLIMLAHSIISGEMVHPSSNRYYIIVNFFGLIYLYYLSSINQDSLILKRMAYLYLPILVLHVMIVLRIDFASINAYLILGNPIALILSGTDESLWTFLFN